jgi:hypothetical protein
MASVDYAFKLEPLKFGEVRDIAPAYSGAPRTRARENN